MCEALRGVNAAGAVRAFRWDASVRVILIVGVRVELVACIFLLELKSFCNTLL